VIVQAGCRGMSLVGPQLLQGFVWARVLMSHQPTNSACQRTKYVVSDSMCGCEACPADLISSDHEIA
jgi:hypothetical protein